MTKQDQTHLVESLYNSLAALRAVIHSAYKLAPMAALVGLSITSIFIWVTVNWASAMLAAVAIVVWLISIGIYAFRGNFGEATLSLVGGLLTALSVSWSGPLYVTFVLAWATFVFMAMIIASVKVAAAVESLHIETAVRLVGSGAAVKPTVARLKQIEQSKELTRFSPIERSEIMRLLAYRKVSIDLFLPALKSVEVLSIITTCDRKTIALFVADVLLSHPVLPSDVATSLVDRLHAVIRDCPVHPADFFQAFANARRLLISRQMDPFEFLQSISTCLAEGHAPCDVYSELVSGK